jgi:hypothetical protein
MRVEFDKNYISESDQLRLRMIKVKEQWAKLRMPKFSVVLIYEHPEFRTQMVDVRSTWNLQKMHREVVGAYEDVVEKELARRKEEVGLVT